MKKKRTYLLLELLIAFTILSFSMLLFIQSPLLFLQDEVKTLEKIELQRIADAKFAEIKGRLHLLELKTPKQKGKIATHSLDPIILNFEGVAEHQFKTSYELCLMRSKKGKNGERFQKVGVRMIFTPIKAAKNAQEASFDYETFLTVKPKEVKPPA
jgi:hypothetical protein